MEITQKSPSAISTTNQESRPYIQVAGAYNELKEKSKSQLLTVSEKALVSAIDKANKAVSGTPHEFNYKYHEGSGHVIVQILNKETHEIIHEIPSEKFIELVEKLQELTVGAIIDEKR
ncbi:flagellar protein FlaG protein [Paenibacillus curdlanolyticus YK9]|uniref:Flagellar protein FlaG protein n=1 Tax=Paenibacillus curdlanolyticus YK9 TaxID=717606 RepID=E0IEC5_9BACL|nr:flagellar protein FlaG [Paenibacillus curdlanolyticus]EFM09013.1 flagellar protein FlaG protein [Paenibacillus curdlanolyticus YK9]